MCHKFDFFFITTIVPDNFCIFIVFSKVYIRQCDTWIPIKNLQVNYIKPASPTYVLKSLQGPTHGSNFLILLSKTTRELASFVSLENQIFCSSHFIKTYVN